MPLNAGYNRDSLGALVIYARPATGISQHKNGVGVDTNGNVYYALETTSITKVRRAGLLWTADGALIVTYTDPVRNIGGLSVSVNGAVYVTSDSPTTTSKMIFDPILGSVLVSTTGALHVSENWQSSPDSLLPNGFSLTRDATNTPGTYFNSTGTLTNAVVNLLLQSQTFDNASWAKSNATITANSTTAPDGTTTADSVVATGVTCSVSQNITKAASTIQYTGSVYVAPAAKTWVVLTLWDGAAVGSRYWFQLTGNGAVGATAAIGAGFTGLSARLNVDNGGFYRIEFTATSNAATTLSFNLAPADSDGAFSSATSGTQIITWGAQLETGSAATTYIPTTTTPGGALRGTYRWNGSAWVFDGTIVEAAATNLHSDPTAQNGGVGWNATYTANTPNDSAWIDGTNKMMRVQWDGVTPVGSYCETYWNLPFTVTANTEYAISCDLKWKQGTRGMRVYWTTVGYASGVFVDVDLVNGIVSSIGSFGTGSTTGTARIENCGGGVYRVMFSGKLDAASTAGYLTTGLTKAYQDVSAYTPNVGDGWYQCGFGIELGNAATSRILVGGATRAADVLTGATSGKLENAQGFAAIEFRPISAPTTGDIIAATNKPMSLNAGQLSLNDGTAARDFLATALTAGTTAKLATTWGGVTCNGATNGTVGTERTFDASMNLGATITVFGGVSANLKALRLGKKAATTAELAEFTA